MKQNWYDFIVPLYNEEYERMLKVAYRRTKSWELAQDLVQDVFYWPSSIRQRSKNTQSPAHG